MSMNIELRLDGDMLRDLEYICDVFEMGSDEAIKALIKEKASMMRLEFWGHKMKGAKNGAEKKSH